MSDNDLFDDNEFQYGFLDVDNDSVRDDGSSYDGDKGGGSDSDRSGSNNTPKKTRGKGRIWTHVRTFGDDSIEAEKLKNLHTVLIEQLQADLNISARLMAAIV